MNYKNIDGKEKLAETDWEIAAARAQGQGDYYILPEQDQEPLTVLVFGGRGGLGRTLHFKDFSVIKLDSSIDIRSSKLISQALDEYQPTVVVNMATRNQDSTLIRQKTEEVRMLLDVNISGGINLLRTTLQWWREKKIQGRFIYVSSVLSTRPLRGTSVYSASKAFNDSLVKTAAIESAPYGITVNSIQLGYFRGENGLCERVPENVISEVKASIPAGRLGCHQDLEKTIKFLIESPYITGTSLVLDGGVQLIR